MIRYRSQNQLTLAGFSSPFRTRLDPGNRWVKVADHIPCDYLKRAYHKSLLSSTQVRPAKDACLVIGAITKKKPLKMDSKRSRQPLGSDDSFSSGNRSGAEKVLSQDDTGTPAKAERSNSGKLILDVTLADQAIRYPHAAWPRKPRTYRQKARKNFLAIVKMRRPSRNTIRRGIKQQLQYLRRNLGHIDALMATWPVGTSVPLPHWLMRRYWVIKHLHDQHWVMHRSKSRRCEDRIVSISQPHFRPIVRGKQHKPVEFGAKLSVSLTSEGLARVEHLRWDAFHEGHDLKCRMEAYHRRYGYFPEIVLGDPSYGSRDNRKYLKKHAIRFAGKLLGRPPAVADDNRKEIERLKTQRREKYLQRIPIKSKFGQGKNGYRLNYILAKQADTSSAWINSIFLVMNLLILLRIFVFPIEIARSRFDTRLKAVLSVGREGCFALRHILCIRYPIFIRSGR